MALRFFEHKSPVGLLRICGKLANGNCVMTRANSKHLRRKWKFGNDFRISNRPVVSSDSERQRESEERAGSGFPRAHGAPMLFAIARDPVTIFAYWSIYWPAIFADNAPVDKQVHLRVHTAEGVEEKRLAVEPMAGNCYIEVSRPNTLYHLEIGYYQPADVWNSVATSNDVTMPASHMSEDLDVDLAAIPFHLSFQDLVDLLGPANDNELAVVISQFQKRALSGEERTRPGPGEKRILRRLEVSLPEIAAAQRAFDEADTEKLARRTGAPLAFGPSSPSRGFEGDWASAGS
jgi:hypothetical protein